MAAEEHRFSCYVPLQMVLSSDFNRNGVNAARLWSCQKASPDRSSLDITCLNIGMVSLFQLSMTVWPDSTTV